MDQLLIVGASARAAAFSALRAGFSPRCVDFFADRDLAALCPASRVDCAEGASGLARAAIACAPLPSIYTGPLENHPDVVQGLGEVHRVLGNSAETLPHVRDPVLVMEAVRRQGLPAPEVRMPSAGLPRAGRWLLKPLASGGGRHVRFIDQVPLNFENSEPSYYQEFIEGPCRSAIFVASQGRASLIGVTGQLIGAPGSPFAYRGSIGPVPTSAKLTEALAALGQALAEAFDLVGLFGVDFVLRCDEPWPVEVNPRYTAAVEVLELALRRPLLAEHVGACLSRPSPLPEAAPRLSAPLVVGKAVLFADRALAIPDIAVEEPRSRDPFAVPESADVPWPGQASPGDPLMTVFATGPDVATCARRLAQIEARWRKRLFR